VTRTALTLLLHVLRDWLLLTASYSVAFVVAYVVLLEVA
jgi:hypothetical protein